MCNSSELPLCKGNQKAKATVLQNSSESPLCSKRLTSVAACAQVAVHSLAGPGCNTDVQLGKVGCQGRLCVGVTGGQVSAILIGAVARGRGKNWSSSGSSSTERAARACDHAAMEHAAHLEP